MQHSLGNQHLKLEDKLDQKEQFDGHNRTQVWILFWKMQLDNYDG